MNFGGFIEKQQLHSNGNKTC